MYFKGFAFKYFVLNNFRKNVKSSKKKTYSWEHLNPINQIINQK